MTLKKALTQAISAWALLGGALLLLIVLATAINAVGFTGNAVARIWGGSVSGLPGYEDGVTMLVGVAALAMFPYCQLHGGHAAVEIFMDKAPAWAQRGVTILSAVLAAAFALTMAVMLIYGTLETRGDRTETAVLGWPVWIFMPSAVLSCALWSLAALVPLLGTVEEASDGA